MRNRLLVVFLLPLVFFGVAMKGDKPAYKLFTVKGKEADWGDLVKEAKKADIVLFGEVHTSPICHWLELELAKELIAENKGKVVLGAEMFETDNQLLLDEYVQKKIRKKDFEAEAKLWKNYATDYSPLVDLAREKGIPFAATNVPRRYAAMVNLKGFGILDSLNASEKALLPPLPVPYDSTLDCYKNILKSMGEGAASHASRNIPKAQAMKDATMAWFILKNFKEGSVFLHFNGSYHSEDFQSISWYLEHYAKSQSKHLRILTIASAEQDTIDDLSKENTGKADFILCLPESMTRTQPQ
jgi:uncharacterized iron-regulated protein